MNIFKYIDLIFQLAGSIVGPPLVGLILGQIIDNRLNTSYLFTLILAVLGIAAGLRSLFSFINKINIK